MKHRETLKQLQAKTPAQLSGEIAALRKTLLQARFDLAQGKTTSLKSYRDAKKTIAMIQTLLNLTAIGAVKAQNNKKTNETN